MFVAANLLIAVAKIIDILLTALYWLILIRAIVSWVNPDPFNPIVQFLYRSTEPILEAVRKILPERLRFGLVDISPLIAILVIFFLQSFLVRTLIDIAYRLHQ